MDVDFSAPSSAFVHDPFTTYEEIRAAGPVVWNQVAHGWMLPNFAECAEVLDDPKAVRFGTVGGRHPELTFWFDAPNMIIADGADHRRLRQGVSRYFTPSAVAARWAPRVREVVEDLMAPLAASGEPLDLIGDFTKIPVVIVAEMLGVPPERHDDFRRWSNIVITNVAFGEVNAESRRRLDEAIAEVNHYMSEEIERHRQEQPDDLLTVMVNMANWSEAEIRSSCINLLLAGYDTTAKLMGECLVALEQHPDQRRLVADDLSLVPNAVEEVLRWHGSTQAIARVVVRDTELAGTPLREGDILYPLLIAANRDPARWKEPHVFDVRRTFKPHLGQPHLGFGVGPHVCIGAPLARLEVQVALETLLRVAPEYVLGGLDYGWSFFVRGPEAGSIDVTRRSPRAGKRSP